ncbi:MAG: AzlD domain-containing protein [Spirochaetaceae bacterium]|jgi:branched-subunit amino acid transport protein AzlD|nr:AzlD domain-containing protein [Spirochaetaceae bacterium]
MSLSNALIATFVMGGIIFLCRIFPLLFIHNTDKSPTPLLRLLRFVERTVPPVAITVLTFNALAVSIKDDVKTAVPLISAVVFTVFVHLWKRNYLMSIFGGVTVFILISRFWH